METYNNTINIENNKLGFLNKEKVNTIFDNLSNDSASVKSFKTVAQHNYQNQSSSNFYNNLSNQNLCGGFGSGRKGSIKKNQPLDNTSNFINRSHDNSPSIESNRKNFVFFKNNYGEKNAYYNKENQNFAYFNNRNCSKNYVNSSGNNFAYKKHNNYRNNTSRTYSSQTSGDEDDDARKKPFQFHNLMKNNSTNFNTSTYYNKNSQFQTFQTNRDNELQLKPFSSKYVPIVRNLEEIYKEDVDHAENYRHIVDDDDEVSIIGLSVTNQIVIDTWEDAPFYPPLLENIKRCKYVRPRKIQAHVIPLLFQGYDIKGHAETGSGKTAAFMLPIIHMLMKNVEHEMYNNPSPYAIIIDPTRELCSQVYEQGLKLANNTGVSVAKAYGQYYVAENIRELTRGCDILCATPGRLKHFVENNIISLDKLQFLVLDEADMLLSSDFAEQLQELISHPSFPDKEHRQTMLFSATFPKQVQKLAEGVLKENCVMVSNQKLVATNSRIIQCFLQVHQNYKKTALLEILEEEMNHAIELNSENPNFCRTLVFVEKKRDADLVSIFLNQNNIKATTINGDRTQDLREKALKDFRTKKVHVLVSTDVCARGIDIKDLDHVINMDLPMEAITYVHRIGRTGRIKSGRATSFFDETNPNNLNIAPALVKFLIDVQQPVPDFLMEAVNEMGDDNFSDRL